MSLIYHTLLEEPYKEFPYPEHSTCYTSAEYLLRSVRERNRAGSLFLVYHKIIVSDYALERWNEKVFPYMHSREQLRITLGFLLHPIYSRVTSFRYMNENMMAVIDDEILFSYSKVGPNLVIVDFYGRFSLMNCFTSDSPTTFLRKKSIEDIILPDLLIHGRTSTGDKFILEKYLSDTGSGPIYLLYIVGKNSTQGWKIIDPSKTSSEARVSKLVDSIIEEGKQR